jgi:hypothetical protein
MRPWVQSPAKKIKKIIMPLCHRVVFSVPREPLAELQDSVLFELTDEFAKGRPKEGRTLQVKAQFMQRQEEG